MSGVTREEASSFDAAVDQALESLGPPPQDDGPGGGREDVPPARLRDLSQATEGGEGADPEAGGDDGAELTQRSAALTDQQAAKLARVEKYSDFIDDVENNPAFRRHILSFFEPGSAPAGQAPAKLQEEPDPLADYDEKDRKAIGAVFDRREAALLQKIGEMLTPFREQMAQTAAEREMSLLAEKHPDWKQWATTQEIAEIRAQFPQLNVLAAYQLASFDKVRARVSGADRKLATVKQVLSRQAPAESQPRRHVRVEKRETSYDEAFDKAYAQIKAAHGSPGR